MYRDISLQEIRIDREEEGGDLIVDMAFSSDEPYERWWGVEILDHSQKSIRTDRLNDGASLLFNHNPDELRGVHEPGTVKTDGHVLRGKVRVTSVTESGREAIDLVDSKILRKASVGYSIHKVIEQTTSKGKKVEREIDGFLFERLIKSLNTQPDLKVFHRTLDSEVGKINRDDTKATYRAVDWEPFENSLVTIPADTSVGVGRNFGDFPIQPANTAELKETAMSNETASAGEAAEKEEEVKLETEKRIEDSPKAVDLEISRKQAIENLCKANNLDEKYRDMWIGQGVSIEAVSEDLLNILEERGKSNPQPASKLGITEKEAQKFSFARAITAISDKDWKNAGFELECSRSIAQKLGHSPDPHKFYVPFEVMEPKRRDLDVATAGAAGYLVGTENMGFIEMLRNRSVAFQMGARRLSGLQGSVTVPRQSAAATGYWLATESTQITESAQTFVQMALTPKNVGAYTEISRQLLLQSSPGAEGIVTDDLAQVVATAVDLAALEGSGASGQPTGITNTAGIGAVAGAAIDYAAILESQTDVAAANVTPMSGGYVTTPAVSSLLMQRERFSGTDTPLWNGNIWNGDVSGFRGMSSNQLTAATMLFGDWQELVIAEWGVLEVEVNPYANFQAGIIGVRAMYSMDVGVRRPFAFSLTTSIS